MESLKQSSTMPVLEIRDGHLVSGQRPVPIPGPDEFLIRVAACGVNRADLLQRKGLHPPPSGASDIPGLEVSGWISTSPEDPDEVRPVCALLTGGGYAAYTTAPRALCLPVPEGLTMAEAAALPEAAFTAWTALFLHGDLQDGQTVLVHGGASGIGTLILQIATAFGAHVLTTAGSEEKCAACLRLGAKLAINYRAESSRDFADAALDFTGGRGVDLVVDLAGGPWLSRNLSCLAQNGRHVSLAWLRGAKAEIPVPVVMRRGLTLTGFMLRERPLAEKAQIASLLKTRLWPLIESGKIRPVLHRSWPMNEGENAHTEMEEGTGIGKRVLTILS